MLVQVVVGLDPEELGGDELAVLGVPLRKRQFGGVVGERPARVLVQADGDADVVLAKSNGVSGLLNGARGGGAGVEHVGERDARQPDEPRHRVRVGDLVAAAEAELDVLPIELGVGECEPDGVGAHLDGRLVEPAEGMQAHADDGYVVAHGYLLYTGWKAKVTISLPSASVVNGIMVSSTSMPNVSFSGSFSVSRPSTRTLSPS